MNAQAERAKVPPIVHDVVRSPGAPLDLAARRTFESQFAHDFSRVRVHTGEEAAASVRAVGAEAYTAGRHVVFGSNFAPSTSAGGRVLAHELAHVAQQRGAGDATPRRIGAADSPAERNAEQLAERQTSSPAVHADNATVHRYRPKGSPNFASFDPPGFTEEWWGQKKDQPWIEKITVKFDGTCKDSTTGETIPIGTMTAEYHKAALPTLTGWTTGGSPSQGLTDIGNFSVARLEGLGYNNVAITPKSDQLPGRPNYKKGALVPSAPTNMSYAVFFFGGEALHVGPPNIGSHSCVHADWDPMRQINYHSRPVHTKVSVSYTSAALDQPCCERAAIKKVKVAPAPCNKADASACGKTPAAPSSCPAQGGGSGATGGSGTTGASPTTTSPTPATSSTSTTTGAEP